MLDDRVVFEDCLLKFVEDETVERELCQKTGFV